MGKAAPRTVIYINFHYFSWVTFFSIWKVSSMSIHLLTILRYIWRFKMTIGERLRKWRKDNKLSTTEISEKTGVSTGGMSDYENNKKLIGSKSLLALYEVYKIDINWILTGVSNDNLISNEQEQLLCYFKICDKEAQEDIIRFAKRCAISQSHDEQVASNEEKSSICKTG